MPYRIDISGPPDDALDRLVQLGALDVESVDDGLAAIMPDAVAPKTVANTLNTARVEVSAASGRDNGSVWILSPRTVHIAGIVVAPAGVAAPPDALRLTESVAFGTGLHPTTALCLEALADALAIERPDRVLDVGTGSGILALAALLRGVPRATGLDIDAASLATAAANARLNDLEDRLRLVRGGPDVVDGTWPLVLANILAGPLMEMAPSLVRRLGHHSELILSGIPTAVAPDVERAYRRLGLHLVARTQRGGWVLLMLRASW